MQNELRVAHLIGNLGVIALEMDDPEKAQPLLEESLSMCRALGNKSGMITALGKLAELAQQQGDYSRMRSLLHRMPPALYDTSGERLGITKVFEGFAALELAQGEPTRAATILGAVEGLVTSKGASMPPPDRASYESLPGRSPQHSERVRFLQPGSGAALRAWSKPSLTHEF